MPVTHSDLAKERKQKAFELAMEVQGEQLNLGKKISVPRDVMMEELGLLSNKASRMFHERQKRADKFILERVEGNRPVTAQNTRTTFKGLPDGGKENYRTELFIDHPGKAPFLSSLKKATAKQDGNPSIIAPGYSGPLKKIPHEKFNVTVIPKSYRSPWTKNVEIVSSVTLQLPEPPQKPATFQFRCFNRVPVPFGGTGGRERTFPLPGFELSQAQTEPSLSLERMLNRPNFNRAPKGWGMRYSPESEEL
ncbi:myozenin-2 [Erpetoichthys calabaricus]|uniref:myozenin-2 n=1 Tax=Erpetoichthys calabaricus TaxID=27687 RepID=UPI0022345CF8|nr:myozenin-2 [Erpetoichthys calabaricus]